jgi:colanic acid/amylovoran biosynthesis glycosyltransferase
VSVRLAYLCNLYPAVSHSFVRREIEGVEAAGEEVHRFSLRPAPGDLRDEADIREAARTQSILAQGAVRLICAWLALLIARPIPSLAALATAWRLSAPGTKQKIRHLAYLLEAAWLTRRLDELGVEHLHAHFGTNPAAVALLTHALGGPPFSFTVHGPDEFDAPLVLSLGAKIEAATFVAAISSYGRSQLMRWSKPEHWDKIKLVRCGVDAAFLDAEPQALPANSREFVCVARLSAQKGLPLLIAACDKLRSSGEEFTLTIVGDGDMRGQIEADIRARGIEKCITLAGIRSSAEIREHLLRARVFVLPSFAEGLPVVLMEALALARPVITTAIAGIPELVDNNCGWLIPPGSLEALVNALMQALHASPDELTAKGKLGRIRVQQMHSATDNAAQLACFMTASREITCTRLCETGPGNGLHNSAKSQTHERNDYKY